MAAVAAAAMLAAVAACRDAGQDAERAEKPPSSGAASPAPGDAADLPSDAAGTCPPDEVLAKLNPDIDGSIRSQQQRTGSPVRANLPLYRSPRLSGPLVDRRPSGLDDDLIVMAGARLGTTGPALVRRVRDNVCGWMNVKDLEHLAAPLKLVQLPGAGDGRDLPKRLDARIVVKSGVDPRTGSSRRTPVFREPFDGPEPPESEWAGTASASEVLSVFEVRRPNGRCRVLSEDGCFLKVGAGDTGRSRGAAESIRIRGWMAGRDVAVWPSPLAVYYRPGTEGLKIHATEPSARNGTPYADRGVETRILAFEPPGRYTEPREGNIMRFPVIRGTAVLQREPPLPGEVRPAPYVYEIAFNAPACAGGGRGGCMPSPLLQRGFVYQDGADGDFRLWLGLRRPEFENLRASAYELCESVVNDSGGAVEEAVLKLVKLMTFGDPEPGESLHEYLTRLLKVPPDLATVLKGTPQQFASRLRQPRERADVIAKVCRSAKLLNMIGEGQTVDHPARDIDIATEGADAGHASFRRGMTPRPFEWRWTSPDVRSQWLFIPMDYLP
jgi:hypothetical protein